MSNIRLSRLLTTHSRLQQVIDRLCHFRHKLYTSLQPVRCGAVPDLKGRSSLMGWPFGKQNTAQPKEEPAKRLATQPESAQPDAKPASQRQEGTSVDAATATEPAADLAPAIFEFGGAAVDSGITMKGICAVDDPDQIQACLWRVDPTSKDTPQEESKYQIFF